MDIDKAQKRCRQMIQDNNEIIKEAQKNNDTNTMQLMAGLDNDSIAIEIILNELEKKDKVISELKEKLITENKLRNKAETKLQEEVCKHSPEFEIEMRVELDKKDKVIDLMIQHILANCSNLVETFCKDKTENRCKYICDYCIKEYFKKKVEG